MFLGFIESVTILQLLCICVSKLGFSGFWDAAVAGR